MKPEVRMRMSFTDYNGSYSVECQCGETLDDVIQQLVVPVLLAAGYHRDSIDEYMEGKDG